MQVDVITDYGEFLSLETIWNDLLSGSDHNAVYLTHEWFRCWWLGYGGGKNIFMLLVRDRDRVIGIAPLLWGNARYRNIFEIKELNFWESGVSPRLDFIALAGRREAVMRCIIEYLLAHKQLWDAASFRKIMLLSETYNVLSSMLSQGFVFFRWNQAIQSPFIRINSDWETYYANRSGKFRKVMRNKINRLNQSGTVEVEKIRDRQVLLDTLPTIFKISGQSWKADQGTAIPTDTARAVFFEELTRIGGERDWVNIWLLKCGRQAIAFEYHLRYGDTVFTIRGDYDQAYKDVSPGSVLEYHIIKTIFEERQIKEYDFCGDNYPYMLNWTDTTRSHVHLKLFNSRNFSKLLGFAESSVIPRLSRIIHRGEHELLH